MGKFKKKWFGPLRVQYCLPNNIIILVCVNKFEPNPILVNVNKLKPYKYVDQTLNEVQNLENQAFIESIDLNHMKEQSNENIKGQRKKIIIGIDLTIVLEKPSDYLMSQQVMKVFINNDYTISQLLEG